MCLRKATPLTPHPSPSPDRDHWLDFSAWARRAGLLCGVWTIGLRSPLQHYTARPPQNLPPNFARACSLVAPKAATQLLLLSAIYLFLSSALFVPPHSHSLL